MRRRGYASDHPDFAAYDLELKHVENEVVFFAR
jgi:hypothetical protein